MNLKWEWVSKAGGASQVQVIIGVERDLAGFKLRFPISDGDFQPNAVNRQSPVFNIITLRVNARRRVLCITTCR